MKKRKSLLEPLEPWVLVDLVVGDRLHLERGHGHGLILLPVLEEAFESGDRVPRDCDGVGVLLLILEVELAEYQDRDFLALAQADRGSATFQVASLLMNLREFFIEAKQAPGNHLVAEGEVLLDLSDAEVDQVLERLLILIAQLHDAIIPPNYLRDLLVIEDDLEVASLAWLEVVAAVEADVAEREADGAEDGEGGFGIETVISYKKMFSLEHEGGGLSRCGLVGHS